MSKGRGQWKDRVLDDSDIDRTPEYAEFIKKLQEYHDKRGYVACPILNICRRYWFFDIETLTTLSWLLCGGRVACEIGRAHV